jgi:hypothetical protein
MSILVRFVSSTYIIHGKPPRSAGKDASDGELRATYTHATAHLRGSLPNHIHNEPMRLHRSAVCPRIRDFLAPNSSPAPAARRAYTPIAPHNLWLKQVRHASFTIYATF